MVRVPGLHCLGLGSIPGRDTGILEAIWQTQEKKNWRFTEKEAEELALRGWVCRAVSALLPSRSPSPSPPGPSRPGLSGSRGHGA